MTSGGVTRRDLVKSGGGALVTASLAAAAGCSFFSTDPASKKGNRAAAGAKESPMLTERVKAGKLPPLEKRLPKDPMVVKPLEAPGIYGGTLQRGLTDRNFSGNQYMAWAGLLEWTPTVPAKAGPGLVHKWDVSDGGKVCTFHLRDGLKWSDGEPFTTDDIMYAYNDFLLDKELSPAFPTWLASGGKPAKFVQVDKLTLRMEFAAPNAFLFKNLCFMQPSGVLLQPKHYMRKFHRKYVSKAEITRLMQKHKVRKWLDLYELIRNNWKNGELPILGPWMIEKEVGAGSAATLVRNPYYWKVDDQGRQLPYIDRAVFTVLPPEALGLRAANGQIDLAAWDIQSAVIPQLMQNEPSKPYKVLRWKPDGQFGAINLNLSHPDPVLRKLFHDIDFRAGLSHAIDRKAINDSLLAGQGRIQHPCAQPGDPYFEEGMGERFTKHDEKLANRLLDKAGLTKRDGDGMRLRPDGKPMKLVATTLQLGVGIDNVDLLEAVRQHWKKVGIDMAIRNIKLTLWEASVAQGKNDILVYPTAGYFWDIDPLWYVPTQGVTYWAPRYGNWYANPGDKKFGLKPDGDIRKLQVLFDRMSVAEDAAERTRLGKEILRLHDKNVWIIGTVQPPFSPVVVSEDLANVPKEGIASYRTHYEGAMDLAQIYFKTPEKH